MALIRTGGKKDIDWIQSPAYQNDVLGSNSITVNVNDVVYVLHLNGTISDISGAEVLAQNSSNFTIMKATSTTVSYSLANVTAGGHSVIGTY